MEIITWKIDYEKKAFSNGYYSVITINGTPHFFADYRRAECYVRTTFHDNVKLKRAILNVLTTKKK